MTYPSAIRVYFPILFVLLLIVGCNSEKAESCNSEKAESCNSRESDFVGSWKCKGCDKEIVILPVTDDSFDVKIYDNSTREQAAKYVSGKYLFSGEDCSKIKRHKGIDQTFEFTVDGDIYGGEEFYRRIPE